MIKPRRPRRDKGIRLMTARDRWILKWIGEQYSIRFDQLQVLLSRQPGQRNGKSSPAGISDSAVNQVIARWQREPAWVEYKRIYRESPGWIWLTPQAEGMIGLTYARHFHRESRLIHRYFINAVRLNIESRHPEYVWISERQILSQQPRRERNDIVPHTPDAEIWLDDERAIAVEVELSPKRDEEIDTVLDSLLGGTEPRYRGVWYFVSESDPVYKQARRVVEEAYQRLAPPLQSQMQIISLEQL